jgi:hypothetical protein
MASGIDISKHPDIVVEGLIQAQLDSQLIDYYKLMVSTYVAAKDSDKANDSLEKLKRLIVMDDSPVIDKDAEVRKILDEMDNWKVTIDPSSLSLPDNRLIERKHVSSKKRRSRE